MNARRITRPQAVAMAAGRLTKVLVACFVISAACGLWALCLLADWLARGCPDRFR